MFQPDTSKVYQVWEIMFMLTCFVEFCIVPYAACTDIEYV